MTIIDESITMEGVSNERFRTLLQDAKGFGDQVHIWLPEGESLAIYPEHSRTPELSHVLVRHEGPAAFMADGYSKSSGRPAVVLTTSGPGASNMVIGVATASTDSTPLIAVAGQVPIEELGKNRHDEINLVGLFTPITK